jgi:SNF2 family DNA or RNA helicase
MDDWDNLVDELWLEIMDYLPTKDKISLMYCSKRYYELGKDFSLWKIIGYGHSLIPYQNVLIHWMGKQEKNHIEKTLHLGSMVKAIVAGTGIGKTIISLVNTILSPIKGKTLIVLPPTLISTWEEEILSFWNGNPPFKYYILHNSVKNHVKKILLGQTSDFDKADIVIMSNMLPKKNIKEKLFDYLRKKLFFFFIQYI